MFVPLSSCLSRLNEILSAAIIASLLAFGVSHSALAEYPEKPITLLVPFSAGGGNDQVVRIMETQLEKKLGQPFAVINRTGANGYVAAQALLNAQPDGYTIANQSLGTFILTSLADQQEVDPIKDVKYVGQMARISSAVAVAADSPYKTLDDLLKAMREKPGQMTWGHSGRGGFNHVNGVSLLQAAGVEARDVPFQGSAKSRAALMGGQIDMAIQATSNYLGFEDKIRFLAFLGEGKDPLLPDVPGVDELGLDMVTVQTPSVMTVHPDTPKEVVDKLEAAMKEIVATEDYQKAISALGITPVFATGAEVDERIESNIEEWRKIIETTKE